MGRILLRAGYQFIPGLERNKFIRMCTYKLSKLVNEKKKNYILGIGNYKQIL